MMLDRTSSVRMHMLSNGLRVVLDPMQDAHALTLGIWVGVGARFEPKADNGLAHFLEHMAFKGTKKLNALQIARVIEDVGGMMNAWTSRECTSYYARVLPEHGGRAMGLLFDILSDSVFDEKELERERGVILQEIGMCDDTPEDVVWDNFQKTAFPDQAMGRPILGTRAIIKSMARETIRDFIASHYKASNMVVGVAGKIDEDATLPMIEELFSSWDGAVPPQAQGARYMGGENFEHKKLEQSHIVWGMEAASYSHELYHAMRACANIYGGGMASRLFQEIREKRGLAYAVSSFYQPYRDSGFFGFYAGTSHARVDEVRAVGAELFAAMGEEVSDEELTRAKEVLKSALLMAQDNASSRIDRAAQQWLIYDDIFSLEESLGRIDAIGKDDIYACIHHLTQSTPTLSVLGEGN